MPAEYHVYTHPPTPTAYHGYVKQDATFDTSFWVNAFRSGLLPYVRERYILHYAPDVAAELRESNPSGREFHRLVQEGQVTEVTPAAERIREFGRGERAAMSLVIEYPDWVLLIDDRNPFQEAARRGLNTICTPLLGKVPGSV